MRKEVAEEWAEALPHYKRTSGTLNRGGEFCCLGVLCELAVKHDVIPPGKAYLATGLTSYGGNTCETHYLPQAVQEWAGMRTKQGHLARKVEFPNGDTYHSLSVANDAGVEFQEIAQVIREKWELL